MFDRCAVCHDSGAGVRLRMHTQVWSVDMVQVGVVRASEGRVFRVLSNAEVEEHLTAISERD